MNSQPMPRPGPQQQPVGDQPMYPDEQQLIYASRNSPQKGLSMTSLVLGIVGLLLTLATARIHHIIPALALLLGIGAITFYLFSQIYRKTSDIPVGGSGSGFSLTGLITGIIATVISLIALSSFLTYTSQFHDLLEDLNRLDEDSTIAELEDLQQRAGDLVESPEAKISDFFGFIENEDLEDENDDDF